MELNKITILWDFDGTLFDTYPMFTDLFLKVLNHTVAYEEVYKQLKVSFGHAKEYFQITDEQLAEIRSMEEQWPVENILPFPGVEQVLKNVGKNVIMTHKSRHKAEKILIHHELMGYFAEIVSGDDGFPRKPDPASYVYLNERHHLDLVIGDRMLDIIPGKKIGIKSCLFQNNEPGADFYLDDYASFYEKVGKYL